MKKMVEVNVNNFRKMLWESDLTIEGAGRLVGNRSYFSGTIANAKNGYMRTNFSKLKTVCDICDTDPKTLIKNGKLDENESELYEQESLDSKPSARIILDIPDFYNRGVMSVTLARVNDGGPSMSAAVYAVDLKKSHHWVLDKDGAEAVTEETENGKA